MNGLVATFGFQLFRATTRYSIFLLALGLLFGVRRLSVFRSGWTVPIAGLAACVVLWDQFPPQVSQEQLNSLAVRANADRDFTRRLEARLPPEAMLFQLPVIPFPEPEEFRTLPYEHFRPYLYSTQLRFSFGSTKGRLEADWQNSLVKLPIPELVSRLESYGFAGVYVNGTVFRNRGAALARLFEKAGRGERIEGPDGLFCILLHPSASPIKPPLR
jgi:hypothetical protein